MQRSLAGIGASLTRVTVKAVVGTAALLLAAVAMAAGRYYPLPALIGYGAFLAALVLWGVLKRTARPTAAPRQDGAGDPLVALGPVPSIPIAEGPEATARFSALRLRRFVLPSAAFISVAVLALGTCLLIGGRFSTVAGPGGVFVTDRFSGNVRFCNASQCQRLDDYDPWRIVSGPGAPRDGQ